jgi:plastocyanin
MTLARRRFLQGSGGVLAALALPLVVPRQASAAEPALIEMIGLPDGSDVWFDPIGLFVRTGQAVRWSNRDAGNSHTATAYHPDLFGRSRRIPLHAQPWNSDYLLQDASFTVTFDEPGVYDYYCLPHEHAGMVGRIVVGDPQALDWWKTPLLTVDSNLPDVALAAFPSIAEIIKTGYVRRAQ